MNSAAEVKTERFVSPKAKCFACGHASGDGAHIHSGFLKTEVILFDVSERDAEREEWTGTLGEFLCANSDDMDEKETARIVTALAKRGRAVTAGFVGCLYELRIAAEVIS